MEKITKFISKINLKVVAIVLLAGISAYFLSGFYISTFKTSIEAVAVDENSVRDSVSEIVAKAKNKTPQELTARENFILAENNLASASEVRKESSGEIKAVGVTQTLFSKKYKKENNYFIEEISKSSVVAIASRQYFNTETNTIDCYDGSEITTNSATWASSPNSTISLEDYKNTYGISPNQFVYYIVSSKTVTSEKKEENSENGNLVYTIELETNYSVMNYSKKINVTSGGSKQPKFTSISITFEIDNNWKFQKIKYNESYEVSIPALGSMYVATTGVIQETYEYENVVIPYNN